MNFSEVESRNAVDVFWGEMAACDHCVQIYENDESFLDALEGFVAGGIRTGEAIILIATPGHLDAIAGRLAAGGFDVEAAAQRNQYIALDAKETLSRFMVDGWPDEELFHQTIKAILQRVRGTHRQVRAFGEMVALMWAEGNCGATVRLEHLWTRLCQQESFSLFCAYPKAGFTQQPAQALAEVCAAHSRLYSV